MNDHKRSKLNATSGGERLEDPTRICAISSSTACTNYQPFCQQGLIISKVHVVLASAVTAKSDGRDNASAWPAGSYSHVRSARPSHTRGLDHEGGPLCAVRNPRRRDAKLTGASPSLHTFSNSCKQALTHPVALSLGRCAWRGPRGKTPPQLPPAEAHRWQPRLSLDRRD